MSKYRVVYITSEVSSDFQDEKQAETEAERLSSQTEIKIAYVIAEGFTTPNVVFVDGVPYYPAMPYA